MARMTRMECKFKFLSVSSAPSVVEKILLKKQAVDRESYKEKKAEIG
jgi:hypothetical protein